MGPAARAAADLAVPAREVRLGGARRLGRRPHLRDRLGARADRVAVQGRLRGGEARRARAREDARARGAPASGSARPRSARPTCARRSSRRRSPTRPRRTGCRGARARGRDPRAAGGQAAARAGGGRRPRRLPARPVGPGHHRACRCRSTSAGPPPEPGQSSSWSRSQNSGQLHSASSHIGRRAAVSSGASGCRSV